MEKKTSIFCAFYIIAFQIDFLAQWFAIHTYYASIILFLFIGLKSKTKVFTGHLILSSILLCFDYPYLSNHGTLYLINNIVMLSFLLRKKPLSHSFSLLKSIYLISFIWSGIHKINSGFFDSKVSCANLFLNRDIPLLESQSILIPLSVILVEVVTPILLLYFKRNYFLFVLAGFHLITVFFGLYDFVAVAFAIHLLFLTKLPNFSEKYLFSLGAIGFILSILVHGELNAGHGIVLKKLDFIYGLLFLFLYGVLFYKNLKSKIEFSPLTSPNKIFLSLFQMHFLAAYIGLYNGGNFTMFSNLNTTKEYGNHYLIPNIRFIITSPKYFNHRTEYSNYRCAW